MQMPRKRDGKSAGATRQILTVARGKGVLRASDTAAGGIGREQLARLARRGVLQRLSRGLYALPSLELTENHSLAEAAKVVPKGVICLLSALRFHKMTTQNPFEVWVAVGHKAWRPRRSSPPLRIVHMSGEAAEAGVEEHTIEGVRVKVFGPAKTVADCFRFRNKIGLDVATEALREFRRLHRGRMDELWRSAQICRVAKVMQPYLDAAP